MTASVSPIRAVHDDPLVTQACHVAMLEAAHDAIVSMGADGVVLEWNPAAVRTFGYSREEAVGRELAELIVPPAQRVAHRAGLQRHLATGSRRSSAAGWS